MIWQKSKWILIIQCNIQCLETKATQKVVKFYYSEGESLHCAVSVLMSRQCSLSAGRFHLHLCVCIDLQRKLHTTRLQTHNNNNVCMLLYILYRHETLEAHTQVKHTDARLLVSCSPERCFPWLNWGTSHIYETWWERNSGWITVRGKGEDGRREEEEGEKAMRGNERFAIFSC